MTAPWRFLPCNSCCEEVDCLYFSDSFDRDDSTNLGVDWTEVAADWETKDNECYLGTSQSGLVICDETQPDGDVEMLIKMATVVSGGTWPLWPNNDDASVVFGYVDASNYFKATVSRTDTTKWWLRLYEISGGVSTQIGPSSLAVGTGGSSFSGFYICVRPPLIEATCAPSGFLEHTLRTNATATVVGTQVGFEVGTNSGYKAFDSLALYRHRTKLPKCDRCIICTEYTDEELPPNGLDVTLSGIVATDPPDCVFCPDLDGVYRLDAVWYREGFGCVWRYYFSGGPCTAGSIRFFVSGTYGYVRVHLGLGTFAQFKHDFGTSPVDIGAIDQTFTYDYTFGSPPCKFSAATCHVKTV